MENVHKFFLINVLWEVPDNDVCFTVEIVLLLFVEYDLFSVDSLVVHLVHASLCLFLFDEIEVAEAKLLVCLFVKHNLGTLDFVSATCEKFEQVQVICVFGQVSHVETVVLVPFAILSLLSGSTLIWENHVAAWSVTCVHQVALNMHV